ncbi:MAG: hypothetical protein LAP39_18255 [Acidobacteriia bacterium]|nr:hypothetical protein [Terriglobia bacterium]
MYTVKRDDGEATITDKDGRVVFKASTDSYVVYDDGSVSAKKIKDLTDDKLLIALAKAVPLKTEL